MSDFQFISTEQLDNLGTPLARYKKNIDALTLLRGLKESSRTALSEEEITTLTRYIGWGSTDLLNKAFPRSQGGEPSIELKSLLTDDELSSLRSSTLRAFFTPLPVIAAIYDALDYLGLTKLPSLRILEPAAGIGHFLGAMPDAFRDISDCVAVEIDRTCAAIFRLLYPNVKLREQPFEDTRLPQNFFDLVIGNVPFGDYPVADSSITEPHLKQQIHDYFFVKTLSLTRPGGIVALLTSTGTLDKTDDRVRRHLAVNAQLLTTLRLPNNLFSQNAGTDVVTDLVLLRKRARPDENAPQREAWIHTEDAPFPLHKGGTANARINRAYLDLPSQILGVPVIAPSMHHGSYQLTVQPDRTDLRQAIVDAITATLPHDLLVPASTTRPSLPSNLTANQTLEREARQELEPATTSFHASSMRGTRAAALVDIFTAAKRVVALQVADSDGTIFRQAQDDLNRLYDDFTRRFGYINSKENQKLFRRDNPFVSFLRALEIETPTRGFSKSRLFTDRTINTSAKPTEANNPQEALIHSLNELGKVDIDYIASLSRTSTTDAIKSLSGIIFQTPAGTWVTADEYLSGNVRAKLLEAEAARDINPQFQQNVDALQAVQPRPLGPGEIIARLGAGWIPQEIVTAFANALVPDYKEQITYNPLLAAWQVPRPTFAAATTFEATQKWGTPRANAIELIEDALNLRRTAVYDEKRVGSENVRVLNLVETAAAQAKLVEIKEHFMEWVWEDQAREKALCEIYNHKYNVFRARQFDGSHLSLPGTAVTETLRPHQKNGVWRALQTTSVLFNHPVSAGKTYLGVAVAMELRRLGLARKPLVTVPPIAMSTWIQQAQKLYPGIRILSTDVEDFAKDRRGETLSRIATEDWDLIIIPHSSFKLLPLNPDTLRRFIQNEIQKLRSYISDLEKGQETGTRLSIKQLERQVKKLESQLKADNAQIRRDDERTITWDEMGVDALIVDEFDVFKNLHFDTKMPRIAGLPNAESQQAFDMYLKIQYLREQCGRIIALTATPISNTVAETYTLQRYLQPELLESLGLSHFDAWAQMFGDTVTDLELKVDGSGWRQHTRFAKFVNLPELSRLLQQVLDTRTKQELKIPAPRLVGGSTIIEDIEQSDAQRDYIQTLAERADAIKTRRVSPREDNMLMVTSDGRKAALDIRLVRPDLPEDPDSKINHVATNIHAIWTRTRHNSAAQLVFLDLSVPNPLDARSTTSPSEIDTTSQDDLPITTPTPGTHQRLSHSLYHEIKRKLIAKGIPEHEIQFVHSANNQRKRARLIADVNSGKVSVLLGSTFKMGIAMNAQERLIALHHIDAPWRPRDVEQREGRILREGNIFEEVFIFQYVTKGSMDCYIWQILESKARFIHQVLSGEVTQRTAEDIGDMVLTAAQIKAVASGNPQVMQRVQLELNLIKLERLRAAYYNNRSAMRHELTYLPEQVAAAQSDVTWHQNALAVRKPPLLDDNFCIQLKKSYKDKEFTPITTRQDAGKILRRLSALAAGALTKSAAGSQVHEHVGRYREFDIYIHGSSNPMHFTSLFERNVDIQLIPTSGSRPYYASITDTDTGIIQSIDHQLRSIEDYLADATEKKDRLERRLVDIEKEVSQPWKLLSEYRQMRQHYESLAVDLQRQGISVENGVRFTSLTEEELAAAPDHSLPQQATPTFSIQPEQTNPFTGREPEPIVAKYDPRLHHPQSPESADAAGSKSDINDDSLPIEVNPPLSKEAWQPTPPNPASMQFAFDFLPQSDTVPRDVRA